MKRLLIASLALVAALPLAAGQTAAAEAINSGARYATDAYPGFDEVKESTHPEKKTPKWFSWLTGPKMEDSAAQFSYCRELIAEESYSKAARELDALVREWPVSRAAPEAQRPRRMASEKRHSFSFVFRSTRTRSLCMTPRSVELYSLRYSRSPSSAAPQSKPKLPLTTREWTFSLPS